MKNIIGLIAVVFIFNSCVEVNNSFSKLPPGLWRATLELDNVPYAGNEKVSSTSELGDILPFIFELKYDDNDDFYIEIINDTERIKVTDITYGRDKATAKDTVLINFPVYDTFIRAIYEENLLEGYFQVNYRDNYRIPFKAYYGQNYLFTNNPGESTHDLTGKWETTFSVDQEDEYPAIGEFVQVKDKLTGTFLTETGDYRYLNGQVARNNIYLSTFDGAHAFLFKGKLQEDNSIIGEFRSGKHFTTNWLAKKNEDATLTDAFNLTKVIADTDILDFSFVNTDNQSISLNDKQYDGKIKLVQIMGTWCPNCKDETKFLLDYLEKEKPDDLEVIAIGFEKYKEVSKAISILKRYKEKMNIPYQVLYGGPSDKAEALLSLPMLNEIISYPTILFVNKNNRVVKIHTGFSGPATSGYELFQKSFFETIASMRNPE